MNQRLPDKVGIVLSSGYFGFFAHAGFLKALEVSGVGISSISGSSSGALTAGLYMSGHSADDIFKIYKSLKKETFWNVDYTGIIKNLFSWKGFAGLLDIGAGLRFFEPYFIKDFSDSKIPGVIIGLNLTQKKKAVFNRGNLLEAALISSTIPFMFKPVRIENDDYIDGGIVDKSPLWELHLKYASETYFVNLLESSIMNQKQINLLNPFKINMLSQAITRKEDYLLQKQMVIREGCKIVELNSPNVKVSQNHLQNGPKAFENSYQYTMRKIEALY